MHSTGHPVSCGMTLRLSSLYWSILLDVAVILRATTKQDEDKVNCQGMSQSVQGRDTVY